MTEPVVKEQKLPTMKDYDPALAKAFEELRMPDFPSIQEERFAREFLPLFANPDALAGVAIDRWLDVAGNVFMPVNVVRGTEFLFRVPPMMVPTPIKENTGGARHSLYEEIMTAEKKRMVLPSLGEAHMRDFVYSRIDHALPATLEIAKAWNGIFEAYGYPPIELPGVNDKPALDSSQSTAKAQDDVLEITGFREL